MLQVVIRRKSSPGPQVTPPTRDEEPLPRLVWPENKVQDGDRDHRRPSGVAREVVVNVGHAEDQSQTADAEYGDECWASFEGKAVAVGIYKAGELHPSRVFNT